MRLAHQNRGKETADPQPADPKSDGHLLRLSRNLMKSATNQTSPSFRSVVARRASSIVSSPRPAASTGGAPMSKSVTEISKARAMASSRQAATFFDLPLSTRLNAERVIPGGDNCCVRVARSLTDQPRACLNRRIFAPFTLNLLIFHALHGFVRQVYHLLRIVSSLRDIGRCNCDRASNSPGG